MLDAEHLRRGSLSLLASLTGVNVKQWSKWCHSKCAPSLSALEKISQTTGIPLTDVHQAIDARRSEMRRTTQINEEILQWMQDQTH